MDIKTKLHLKRLEALGLYKKLKSHRYLEGESLKNKLNEILDEMSTERPLGTLLREIGFAKEEKKSHILVEDLIKCGCVGSKMKKFDNYGLTLEVFFDVPNLNGDCLVAGVWLCADGEYRPHEAQFFVKRKALKNYAKKPQKIKAQNAVSSASK